MLCKFFSSVNYYYGWFECFIYGEVNFLCVVNNMYVCGVCIVKKKKEKKIFIGCKYIGWEFFVYWDLIISIYCLIKGRNN